MKAFLFIIVFFGILAAAHSQECETAFDFNEWSMEGSPDGDWQVSGTGDVINKSYITPATFFVSQKKLINVLIKGTISVETGSDDDFIGLVFGYQKPTLLADDNPYNFFLFDWKAEKGANIGYLAQEGFRLSYYNGFISKSNQMKFFWGTEEKIPQRRLLKEKYGDKIGWINSQKYAFEMLYTTDRIRISIDGEVIFEHEGCFQSGKFGFYCMSQTLTRFEDFTYQSFIDFIPVPETVCLGEEIHFSAFNLNCSDFPDFIESMNWDFGDGQLSTEINPDHIYAEDGEYLVELIVHKNDNCTDTIVKIVTIKPKPIVDLGNDTIVIGCSSITLDAGNPGSDYSWSTGQISQTIELNELIADTTVWVVVDKNGCLAADTISVGIEENFVKQQLYFPNAFTPNGDGNNDVFTAVGPTDNVSLYQLIIYNRWGQQVFETADPNDGWDGGDLLQSGVYVYTLTYRIEGNCIETKDFTESGTVVLVE